MSATGKKYIISESKARQLEFDLGGNFVLNDDVFVIHPSEGEDIDISVDISHKRKKYIDPRTIKAAETYFTILHHARVIEDKTRVVEDKNRGLGLAAQIVDLLLEPDDAEEAIGDITEGYQKRLERNRGHAIRWLWVQTGWIAVNRCFDLMRRFASAKAGK